MASKLVNDATGLDKYQQELLAALKAGALNSNAAPGWTYSDTLMPDYTASRWDNATKIDPWAQSIGGDRAGNYKIATKVDGNKNWRYLVDPQTGQVMGSQANVDENNFLGDVALPAAAVFGGGLLFNNLMAGLGAAAGTGGAASGFTDLGLGSGAAAGGAGEAAGAGLNMAATNPALIESALGTSGYGASSAGLGGAAGAGAAASLVDPLEQAANQALASSGNVYNLTPSQLSALDAANVAELGASSGGSVMQSLMNGGKSVIDSLGGAKTLLPILGGIAGASEAGKGTNATSTNQIDPRMAQYLYGSGYGDQNSALGALQKLWQDNKTGLNPAMQKGLDMQMSALTDPAYGQAYTQMRNVGTGLLNMPIAGNPFSSGQASLNTSAPGLLAPLRKPLKSGLIG